MQGPRNTNAITGGRPKVEEIMAYFPALLPKELIKTQVEILEA
jgi:hypothetical protein